MLQVLAGTGNAHKRKKIMASFTDGYVRQSRLQTYNGEWSLSV